jgi:hypothetical protein
VPTKTPIPEIYILWHPSCVIGEPLAKRISEWLRPGNGFGPDVFFRSRPAPATTRDTKNVLPLSLANEKRANIDDTPSSSFKARLNNLQIVLVLIDEHMVVDRAWQHWLTTLSKSVVWPARIIMPIALDPTAYNVPPELRELNFLRPAGLPLRERWQDGSQACERIARSLLKQITEALCRQVLPRPTTVANPAAAAGAANPTVEAVPKVNVFLSHAKVDGVTPARRLRDYIYSQTQLTAFFDENDIAFGAMFNRIIERSLVADETAALIAVRSSRYFSRPWCRREFSRFRKPRQDKNNKRCWRLFPALVVEAIDGRDLSYGIPEMGNCPIIRWNEEDSTLEELVVTTLIRDALLACVHSAIADSLELGEGEIAINWLPDPTTLLHIPEMRDQKECKVLYPGRGISLLELNVLQDFFPNATFTSYEQRLDYEQRQEQQMERPRRTYRSAETKGGLVAFSLSYERANLLDRGLGFQHLSDLLTRIARPLLRANVHLAYGGHWRETDDNFTLHLLRLIGAELDDKAGDGIAAANTPNVPVVPAGPSRPLQIGKLYNHCSWPNYLDITPRTEAQWVHCCHIVRVTQEDANIAPEDRVPDSRAKETTPRVLVNAALTLSEMRSKAMEGMKIPHPDDVPVDEIPPVSARVQLGGALDSFTGFMPGIFEEALETLRRNKPLYILGGFGGASEALVQAIKGAAPPELLTLEGLKERNPRLAALMDAAAELLPADKLAAIEAKYDDLKTRLDAGRGKVSELLQTGLDESETNRLLTTHSVSEAVRLTRKGLGKKLEIDFDKLLA